MVDEELWERRVRGVGACLVEVGLGRLGTLLPTLVLLIHLKKELRACYAIFVLGNLPL